ncbi:MAG TPA: hypothetical protein VNG12_26165 [Acidimicrobiales bacterium]|nr:hypothetical protein [Acidimicrobiales bacterium]
MSLTDVVLFRVSKDLVRRTEKTLKAAGKHGNELFVFWSGKQEGAEFLVEAGHVPLQTAYKTPDGLSVEVLGEELHKLNAWLYTNSHVLALQIHCHPHDAYHSETDDRFPIVTTLGGASLVVPEFCRQGLLTDGSVLYRLSTDGWKRATPPASDLIRVA